MGNYEQLKQAVADVIKSNGNQEITGAILQNALLTIISTVGHEATFAGIATPTTNPGTPDQNVFYIASQDGLYSNFNGIILENEVSILTIYENIWVKENTGIATIEQVNKQKEEVEQAKQEALQEIDEQGEKILEIFNSQRITPEMLSESTKQFIEASGGGTITNLADDEDIASIENELGISVLKLADRIYNPISGDGMGYKIIRKNIVDGINVLVQNMINEENTIYDIRYDFNCNGLEINIPNGCYLHFNGGRILNGILRGNVKNKYLIPEWFGAIGDGASDDRQAIQNALNLTNEKILLGNKLYYLSNTSIGQYYNVNLQLPENIEIIGNNTRFKREIGSHVCLNGARYRGDIKKMITNVKINDSLIYIENNEGLNINDKVLLIGEDGTSGDKAEPIDWMFNYIDDIDGQKITLRYQIPFNIDLSRCNTTGDVSTATKNGSISKVSSGKVKITDIHDITYSDSTLEAFIVVKYQSNNEFKNITSINQTAVQLQYSEDDYLENITTKTIWNGNSIIATTALTFWETKNVIANNISHYKGGQRKGSSSITLEGSNKNVIVNNFNLYDSTEYKTNTSELIVYSSEGNEITINNINLYMKEDRGIIAAALLDTEQNKGYIKFNNVRLFCPQIYRLVNNTNIDFFNILNGRVKFLGCIGLHTGDKNISTMDTYINETTNIIPITIHYNNNKTATSDIIWKFKGCYIYGVECETDIDIVIKGNNIGNIGYRGFDFGEFKKGISFKYVNYWYLPEQNGYMSFMPQELVGHYDVKIRLYVRMFNKTGSVDIQTINLMKQGPTSSRPNLQRCMEGYMYFDTTINKPIWNKQNTNWVDSNGNNV